MMRTLLYSLAISTLVAVSTSTAPAADDPVFSGPQVGEALTPFEMHPVLGVDADKKLDLVAAADKEPVVLIFVHELTRPSVGVTRTVMDYVAKRSGDGISGGIVFLSDDRTAMETRILRAKHAMPKRIPVGISVDGAEGPGAYGLNRKVTLTVLVGNKGKVTANYALVQPSVQADVPRIAGEISKALGDEKAPTLAQLGVRGMMRQPAGQDPNIRKYLAPIIRKSAEPADVDAAVKELEAYLDKHPATRKQIEAIAKRIVDADKLENYGTKRAQEFLKQWAEKAAESTKPKDDDSR